MLTVHHLAKSYNLTTLFENVTFSVNAGDRVGLIGPNGCGKTTLIRIIAGQECGTPLYESADSGHVTHASGLRLGYLPQGFEHDQTATLEQTIQRAIGSIEALEDELMTVAVALGENPNDNVLQDRYDEILRRIETADTRQAPTILNGLGLDQIDPHLPVSVLSGGQKTRLSLALVLLNDPQLLLLDEPTNHLDIAMLEWLEQWLARFQGGVLIISHDRTFLDQTCNKILDLDPHTHTVREYAGNYSNYLDQFTREREQQMAAYRDQIAEVKHVKRDIARVKETARSNENKSTSARKGGEKMRLPGYKDYIRSKAKATAKVSKAREKKLERYLGSDERVEKPKRTWQMKLDFAETRYLGKSVLELRDLSVGYKQPLLHQLNMMVGSGERIVITGPNGSGKTTLLRTIIGRIPPLTGTFQLGKSVRLGYMSQEQTILDPHLTPVQTIQKIAYPNETDARTYLHQFLFAGDEAVKPNQLLSFGQRSRLMLAVLIAEGCNLLLLDEPINHLDIPSRTQFEQALTQFEGTIVAVVHDRYFIRRFATEIWWVENQTIRREIATSNYRAPK